MDSMIVLAARRDDRLLVYLFRSALLSMLSPVLEMSLPAPATVLHPPRIETAPKRNNRMKVSIVDFMLMALPLTERFRNTLRKAERRCMHAHAV